MRFLGWLLDVAREQSPTEAGLASILEDSIAAGYGAVGLYLEHRFAWPGSPWAAAPGALEPDVVQRLADRFPSIRLVPFLNTLGHVEGFLRAEGGQRLAEGPPRTSRQLCPSRPECEAFARGLLEDAASAFADPWIHLGGDEPTELGRCARCARRLREEGAGALYGGWFGALARHAIELGRRPCLWADAVLAHPEALERLPAGTVLFDWQYEGGPAETTRRLRTAGFDVVCCPGVRTWDAPWCRLAPTRSNVDLHAAAARDLGALGVLVTAWEFQRFSPLAPVLPVVLAAGRRIATGADWDAALVASGGEAWARAAAILGEAIPAAGCPDDLRAVLVGRGDPFALWTSWSGAAGEAGDRVLELCERAGRGLDPDAPIRFPIALHRAAVEWVRAVDRAAGAYRRGDPPSAGRELAAGRAALETLRPGLEAAALAGGSRADLARLDRLGARVEQVRSRLGAVPAGASWRPAFEVLVAPRWVDGDPAAWDAEVD